MPWKVPDREELKEFLRPSELCDSNHPLVKATAAKITRDARTAKEAAIKIFYFVRDKIVYATVHPWKTASETLKIGKGTCFTKATLQAALLRSVGIPARFRVIEFKGNDPEEWQGILPSFAISGMPERWPHYLVEVYIKGRWIMADATFDRALISDAEDWDGENDVCLLEERTILSDMGAFASIEEEAKKLDEKYRVPVLWIMNGYRFFWIMNLYTKAQRLKNKLKKGKTQTFCIRKSSDNSWGNEKP